MKPSSQIFAGAALAVAVLSSLLSPATARAQGGHGGFASGGPSGFGAQGQIAIDGQLQFSITKVSGSDSTTIRIIPAGDYFIRPNLSLGGVVGLIVTTGRPGSTSVLLGARIGYNLGLNDQIGIWPTAGLSFQHTTVGNNGGSTDATYLNLYAPFLFHLVPHLFVGAGPFVDVGLGDGNANVFGVLSTVGGWF